MKRKLVFVFALALFALLDGYLLSAISFFGKAGISLFYTQYNFLKIWWKGALLVFIIWIFLFVVQNALSKKLSKATSNNLFAVSSLLAIIGMYFSYADFRNSLSHRWLGERFHLGVYLFWLGWIAISVYLLLEKNRALESIIKKTIEES